jgi:hypothetical protein
VLPLLAVPQILGDVGMLVLVQLLFANSAMPIDY